GEGESFPTHCRDTSTATRLPVHYFFSFTDRNPAAGKPCPAGQVDDLQNRILYNLKFPMADITPFRAFRYDPERVAVSNAVTQPYDRISTTMQERYYDASPYNLVRIILGKKQPSDGPSENAYTRAASFFSDWRSQGILKQDSQPAIYPYVQDFVVPGS